MQSTFTMSLRILCLLFSLSHPIAMTSAQEDGEVFPTHTLSSNAVANTAFEVGMVKYTMFNYYSDCPLAFAQALEADPSFVMAAWGMSNCHDHATWAEQYQGLGWEAIVNVSTAASASQQSDEAMVIESLYVQSTKLLFDPEVSSVAQRRLNHRETLKSLIDMYPAEDFAKLLVAQSLIAEANPAEYGYYNQTEANDELIVEARELILRVFETYPNSAFAHHLWIHVNDHRLLAKDALNSSQVLSQLRPGEAHAHHMPSHISLRAGDFASGAEFNIDAIMVNENDGHSKQFLNYCYLNMGRTSDSEDLIAPFQASSNSSLWAAVRFHYMAGNYIHFYHEAPTILESMPIEVQDPDQSDENKGTAIWVSKAYAAALFAYGHLDLINLNGDSSSALVYNQSKIALTELATFLVAQWEGDEILAQDLKTGMMAYELLPALTTEGAVSKSDLEAAKNLSRVASSRGYPGYGYLTYPQFPGQELYGQLLLKDGEYELAESAFGECLVFHPQYLPCMIGVFRAAVGAGNTELASVLLGQIEVQVETSDDAPIEQLIPEILAETKAPEEDSAAPSFSSNELYVIVFAITVQLLLGSVC